jgi:outer membrane protein
MRVKFLSSALLLVIFCNAAMAQTKVCFVNSQALYSIMPETRTAKESLEAFGNQLAQDYALVENIANEKYAAFIKDSATMSPAVKEAKRKSLQDAILDLQVKEPQNRIAYDKKKTELELAIQSKLNAAVKKVALANGYNQILQVDAAIIYPIEDEISEKVKAELGIK